ncbi:unnamed protein product [Nesidiocoris tenuis]|uniref:Uncharacterized protein n=1 Tax=Nesidiocoris tenuis TaxID=355587 RepID=A0A6H5GYZ8_9HEMI|nr:unnamed protein product [Nesidiocoris tenuis]
MIDRYILSKIGRHWRGDRSALIGNLSRQYGPKITINQHSKNKPTSKGKSSECLSEIPSVRFVYVPPGGATGKPLFAAVNRLERPKSTKALERLIKTMRHRRIEPHPRPTHNTRPKTHVNELTYLTSFQFDCCMFDHEIENEFDYELACEFDFEFEYEFEWVPRRGNKAMPMNLVERSSRRILVDINSPRAPSGGPFCRATLASDWGERLPPRPKSETYSPKIESVVQHEIGQWEGTKYCETKGFRKSQCSKPSMRVIDMQELVWEDYLFKYFKSTFTPTRMYLTGGRTVIKHLLDPALSTALSRSCQNFATTELIPGNSLDDKHPSDVLPPVSVKRDSWREGRTMGLQLRRLSVPQVACGCFPAGFLANNPTK